MLIVTIIALAACLVFFAVAIERASKYRDQIILRKQCEETNQTLRGEIQRLTEGN